MILSCDSFFLDVYFNREWHSWLCFIAPLALPSSSIADIHTYRAAFINDKSGIWQFKMDFIWSSSVHFHTPNIISHSFFDFFFFFKSQTAFFFLDTHTQTQRHIKPAHCQRITSLIFPKESQQDRFSFFALYQPNARSFIRQVKTFIVMMMVEIVLFLPGKWNIHNRTTEFFPKLVAAHQCHEFKSNNQQHSGNIRINT